MDTFIIFDPENGVDYPAINSWDKFFMTIKQPQSLSLINNELVKYGGEMILAADSKLLINFKTENHKLMFQLQWQ